jgi:hypothetical protein
VFGWLVVCFDRCLGVWMVSWVGVLVFGWLVVCLDGCLGVWMVSCVFG